MTTFTRRQRAILDLIAAGHKIKTHLSPAKLSQVLVADGFGPCGVNAVRAEIGRLILAKAITDAIPTEGSTPTKFRLADCECQFCQVKRRPNPTA